MTQLPSIPGGYDKRLRENVEYLEELKRLAEMEGVSDKVRFITSCSTSERNDLISECLCVLYTPKVHLIVFSYLSKSHLRLQ